MFSGSYDLRFYVPKDQYSYSAMFLGFTWSLIFHFPKNPEFPWFCIYRVQIFSPVVHKVCVFRFFICRLLSSHGSVILGSYILVVQCFLFFQGSIFSVVLLALIYSHIFPRSCVLVVYQGHFGLWWLHDAQ